MDVVVIVSLKIPILVLEIVPVKVETVMKQRHLMCVNHLMYVEIMCWKQEKDVMTEIPLQTMGVMKSVK